MKTSLFLRSLSVAVAGCVFIATASAEGVTPKTKVRTRTGTYHDSKGHSGTATTTKTTAPGERKTNTTWTNQDGKTGSKTQEHTWNKDTKTGTFENTTTLPNGKTAAREGAVTKTGDNTIVIKGTETDFNGKTRTFSQTKTKTETGATTTGTITRPDGKTATMNSTMTKNDTGFTKETVITGPNGKTTQIEKSLTRAPGDNIHETTITRPDGKTTERTVETKRNADGSGTRTIEVTGADGKTYTRTEEFSAPAKMPAAPATPAAP